MGIIRMNDNPRWPVGSVAKNKHTGNEYLIDKEFDGGEIYRLSGLGLMGRKYLNEHYIMSRVAKWELGIDKPRVV